MTLTIKLLWRDWCRGELNILVFSLLLATATVTGISLFTSRIDNSIREQAAEFLAADAQVRGSQAIPEEWLRQAAAYNLRIAESSQFRSMAFSEDTMQLTAVKAVSGHYPLKGKLQIARQPFAVGETVPQGPPPGEVWLTSRLFGALDIDRSIAR